MRKTGVPSGEDLKKVLPSTERLKRGPVAIFECFERIPCDPCHSSCPTGAVLPFADVNDLPRVDAEKCNGCGACVAACPGLAVFVVHLDYSPEEALVKLPYEFRPLPARGQVVKAMNREGAVIGDGRVVRVQVASSRTATPVVWVAVARENALDTRHIALGEMAPVEVGRTGKTEGGTNEEEETIVCRCEDVTLGQVRQAIREGYGTVDELKRLLRIGMGPCQGRTCGSLLRQEIARITNTPIDEVSCGTYRPPARSVKLGVIALGREEDER